jgi:anti-sigma regulatory factor (Ser/Thr protein kinase)
MRVPHTLAWSDQRAWPHHTQHIADAREFVTQRLESNGLEALALSVRLVVSELVTNAVLHAGTAFSVTVSRDGPRLRLEVRDALPEPVGRPSSPPPTQPNGRGLAIVERLSTQWGVALDPAGKTVWAVFAVTG